MRWHQYLLDDDSPWRNQQTLGISEAFTFELDRRYGPGDHLWKFGAADDLWLGCWGLVRIHARGTGDLPPLPDPDDHAANSAKLPKPAADNIRRFLVVAERRQLVYRERDLIDPFGLVYRLERTAPPGGDWGEKLPKPSAWEPVEPLILRCRHGEWVEVKLVNKLPLGLRPEPFAPEVPVERRARPVSSRVSLHADLVRYDVRHSDGANVGRNPIQTAEPDDSVTYRWYADEDVGIALLQDMADFRNHRHHGLVGALVVEPADAIPKRHGASPTGAAEAWHGSRATIHLDGSTREEAVLILQDGLRLFFHGNPAFPIPDEQVPEDDPGGDQPDVEDQGQKGFNYREPTGEPSWIAISAPATPVFTVLAGKRVWFRLAVGADKPRNHSFTIHGHTWTATHISEAGQRVAAESALSTGWVETFEFTALGPRGDHESVDYAYRTGVLKWALSQGLWGILRVTEE
jgi:hypothetical protein